MNIYTTISLITLPLATIAWLVLDKKQHKLRILFGFAAIASSCPFFINVGMFLGSFNSGMCYSSTINDLSELSILISNQENSKHFDRYQKFLKSLPLHGYETSCDEVNETVVKFKNEILAVQIKP